MLVIIGVKSAIKSKPEKDRMGWQQRTVPTEHQIRAANPSYEWLPSIFVIY